MERQIIIMLKLLKFYNIPENNYSFNDEISNGYVFILNGTRWEVEKRTNNKASGHCIFNSIDNACTYFINKLAGDNIRDKIIENYYSLCDNITK